MDDLGYPYIVVDIMVPILYIIGILGYIGILIPIMYSDWLIRMIVIIGMITLRCHKTWLARKSPN